jgi:hypothetical protein
MGSACVAQVEVSEGYEVAAERSTTTTTEAGPTSTFPPMPPATAPPTVPPTTAAPAVPAPTDLQAIAARTLAAKSGRVRMTLTPTGDVAMTLDGEFSGADTRYDATVPNEPPGELLYFGGELFIRNSPSEPMTATPDIDVPPYALLRLFPLLQRGGLVILSSGPLPATRVGTEQVGTKSCEHLQVDIPAEVSAAASISMDHVDAWVCDGLILRTVFGFDGDDVDAEGMTIDVVLDQLDQPVSIEKPADIAPAPEQQFKRIEGSI